MKNKNISIVASVCTGVFLLAKNGMLHKKKATTHWGAYDTLHKIMIVGLISFLVFFFELTIQKPNFIESVFVRDRMCQHPTIVI